MYNFYKENMVHLPPRSRIHQILRIMKLTTLILITVILHVSAATMAQKVTLVEKNAQLVDVFQQIHKQTGYDFLFTGSDLKNAKPVTINVQNEELADVLTKIFEAQSMDFTIENNTVVIKQAEPSFLDNLKNKIKAEMAQVTVSGKVQDGTGQPLPGVTVRIKDTQTAAVTDSKGSYTITAPDENTILVFTYVGYEPQELKAKDISAGGIITLKASSTNLQEVVINKGYYNEKRALSTGNVGVVTAKEIADQPVTNVLAALEGRVPGLLITQTTGLPGGSFKVQIRGQNSIKNGNDPFYVIDGIPYISQLPATPLNGYFNGGSPLNYIDPNDIENIEVLKDADATAIYGSRAANGAILITTKKGKAGAMKFDFNSRSGITEPARTIPVLNTQQYLAMRHEAFKNDGRTPGPSDHDLNGDWDTTRYTNWATLMANKPAQYTNVNASLSGGTTNTQYLIGGSYNTQKTGFPTLLKGDGGDKTGGVHFNISTSSPDKRFSISLTGSFNSDKNTVQSKDFTNSALVLPPDAPAIFNADGSLNWAPKVPGGLGTWNNPYAVLNNTIVSHTTNLVSNALISYKLLKDLDVSVSTGYTNQQSDEIMEQPTSFYDPARHITSSASQFNSGNSHSWIIEPQINYKLQLGKGVISALAGASFNQNFSSSVLTQARGFISDALLGSISAASSVSVHNNNSQYKTEGVYGRLNYNWEDKYLINLTGRRDGTSRFGPGKQFGNFGAVGAAWIFSNESFFPKGDVLSFGKLRGSYGTTGNDQIGDYQFIDLYVPTYYPYQGSVGLYPQNLFNPDLAWETTKKLEGGIELGFFKNRITAEASIYRNRSSNELVSTPISGVTGFPSIISNLPALVQNTGAEFVLNTINIKTKSFGWSSSFNLTINRNKLISFPGLAGSPYANTLVIGQPVSILKLNEYEGVNPATGLYQFAAANGGTTSTPDFYNDPKTLMDLTPRFFGGFQNSISYKSFSLEAFFQFVKQKGLKLWAANNLIPGFMYNQPTDVLNRWQKPGDQSNYEMFTENGGSAAANAFNRARVSDFAYGDASYIRLKNVALSWQMPQNWAKKIGCSSFRVYVQGQNLLTITKYDGMDPESQSALTGPRRVYVAGLQLGL